MLWDLPGWLRDSKEGLSWTVFKVPPLTVSWCCRWRAGLLPGPQRRGKSFISVPREGDAGWTFRNQSS